MLINALSERESGNISKARGSLAHQVVTFKRDFSRSRLAMCADGRVLLARSEGARKLYSSVMYGKIYLQLRDHVDECPQCMAAQPGQWQRDAKQRVSE